MILFISFQQEDVEICALILKCYENLEFQKDSTLFSGIFRLLPKKLTSLCDS